MRPILTIMALDLIWLNYILPLVLILLASDDTYLLPPNLFNFSAATSFQGSSLEGDYAALPNFVTGEPNFQLIPITINDIYGTLIFAEH